MPPAHRSPRPPWSPPPACPPGSSTPTASANTSRPPDAAKRNTTTSPPPRRAAGTPRPHQPACAPISPSPETRSASSAPNAISSATGYACNSAPRSTHQTEPNSSPASTAWKRPPANSSPNATPAPPKPNMPSDASTAVAGGGEGRLRVPCLTCLTSLDYQHAPRPGTLHDPGEIRSATGLLGAGVPSQDVQDAMGSRRPPHDPGLRPLPPSP